ncbi:MAG TPA: PIN domain-containing protein [Candidatus Binatia bacterium]|nr:PIN domain-containing protein [Candidatus Binatia bacterium]
MNAIVDTGFLVALMEARDSHHTWAVAAAGQIDWPALTCESVLSETAFHIGSSEPTLQLVSDGLLEISFDFSRELAHLLDLASRYADRHPDLADICLIRMSELHPKHTVVTVDEDDFRVYRRNKREAIPLLCPPKSRK